ncbi:MAG: type II secretion system GspH family protein [Oscillospiraceae bacterium]|nr:type II secretion system GspH family protein [Oscillospiraceae bacterium]
MKDDGSRCDCCVGSGNSFGSSSRFDSGSCFGRDGRFDNRFGSGSRLGSGLGSGSRFLSEFDGGFTLIELIVVIAVMAVLFSVLLPPMLAYRETIYERERLANMSAINDAIRQCYALEGRYPPAVGDTGLDYLREHYQIIVKPDKYEYSYAIVGGSPVLAVGARERQ